MDNLLMNLIFTLFFLAIIGFCCSAIAKRQGRSPALWFFIGFLFGIFGFIILLLLPLFTKFTYNRQTNQRIIAAKKTISTENVPCMPVEENPSIKQTPWFYLDNTHTSIGPISFTELLNLWRSQVVSTKSYVWQETMSAWEKVQNLPYLRELLEQE